MNWKDALLVFVVVTLLVVGRHLIGIHFTLGVFIVLGGLGFAGTAVLLRRRNAIAEFIALTGPTARERLLVHLENEAFRPALLHLSGAEAPPVPLRRDVERFAYPTNHQRSFGRIGTACLLFAGFLAVGWISDLSFGGETFSRTRSDRIAVSAMIVGFGLGGWAMFCFKSQREGTLEVSSSDLAWLGPRGSTKRIAWREVTKWEVGELADSITVRSATARIAVDFNLDGFGRAVNLIATRIPGHVPSRTS